MHMVSRAARGTHPWRTPTLATVTPHRLLAAPRSKLPERRVHVFCCCGAKLFKYAKANGASSKLVKVYRGRVVTDYTAGGTDCPKCAQQFAREDLVHGKPALRVLQGRVSMK
eukprot:TRINITY_DN17274_c0_g1_i2.p1 TRINITY_DN17274_c0_g1~~TRINITY_DN17274_c0_g1_i2.p1  ORF type:complete len:112 (+),score=14.24 TRINITY_DN17274_c0_g1_i2:49-384(+)